LTNDPRLFSNHLVWNKNKNIAESVDDKKYSAPSAITVISTTNTFDPVARAVSPGQQLKVIDGTPPCVHNQFITPSSRTNSRNEIEIKIQTGVVTAAPIPSQSPLPPRPSPHHAHNYDVQINKLNQTKNKLNNNIKQTKQTLVDSAYNTNTNSSNEDAEIEKITRTEKVLVEKSSPIKSSNITQTFEKYSPFYINESTKREYEMNNNTSTNHDSTTTSFSTVTESVIDRLKMQHEEKAFQKSSQSTTSSNCPHHGGKIVGGVKV
jgi:hypothetical protein